MAADARTELAPSRALSLAALRLTPHQAVAVIVAASVIGRTLASWLRTTPLYFPDEYIYSEIGRSIAEHGRPAVRGGSAHFPALLQPLLTAPAWLFDDVTTSFRMIQLTNAVVMSLGAVAIFWLARRLELSPWLSVGVAAFSVAMPAMFYTGWVLAEPFAFPLLLASVGAGTASLARPSKRGQLIFIGFAALTCLARVQYVILPLCFALAAILMGLRERRVRAAIREQGVTFGLLGLGAVTFLAAGAKSVLGYYQTIVGLDLSPGPIFKWFGSDAMMLLYSSGWVLVPGALLAAVVLFRKPRSRTELAFVILGTLVVLALLAEAAIYGANGADRIQERYFFSAVPLIALLFGLYAKAGFPHPRVHALLAGAALALSARVPLAGFSAGEGKSNSPLLFAVGLLEQELGNVGTASLIVAGVVGILSLLAATAVFFPRKAAPILLCAAVAASVVVSIGTVSYGHRSSAHSYAFLLSPDASYVDRAELGSVALLETPLNTRSFSSLQLFWNRSLERVLLMPNASPPDAFAADHVQVRDDGSLGIGDDVYEGPILVDTFGATSDFRGVEQVDRRRTYTLFAPTGTPRLALYTTGRYFDGWLGLSGEIHVWPADRQLSGRLETSLSLPPGFPASTLRFKARGETQTVTVRPGKPTLVSLPVCSEGPWSATFDGSASTFLGDRLVTVLSTRPVYAPDSGAC